MGDLSDSSRVFDQAPCLTEGSALLRKNEKLPHYSGRAARKQSRQFYSPALDQAPCLTEGPASLGKNERLPHYSGSAPRR